MGGLNDREGSNIAVECDNSVQHFVAFPTTRTMIDDYDTDFVTVEWNRLPIEAAELALGLFVGWSFHRWVHDGIMGVRAAGSQPARANHVLDLQTQLELIVAHCCSGRVEQVVRQLAKFRPVRFEIDDQFIF